MNAQTLTSLPAESARPHVDRAAILIVDDEEAVRNFERRVLEGGGHHCTTAASPAQARECLKQEPFDLAIVDFRMPGESGMELAKYIRADYPDTAVLMVTGEGDPELANQALDAGAYGYLVKPFEGRQLLIDVAGALRRRKLEIDARQQRDRLEQLVTTRTDELNAAVERLSQGTGDLHVTQEETILLLARAGESRCDQAGQHVQRMSRYCALIAKRLGWDEERCETIRLASMLHDVGKIGVPDGILLKQGPLTADEFAVVKQHVELGRRILLRMNAGPLQMAATIAWTHHERFDGSGYGRRLAGEAIPLEGRIAAVADVFDALTSHKVYRPAYPLAKAVGIMRHGRGTQFDPALLDLFLQSMDEVAAIRSQYPDGKEE